MNYFYSICFTLLFFDSCAMHTLSNHTTQIKAAHAYKNGNFAQALCHYTQLASDCPTDTNALMSLGNSLYQQKEYDKATKTYKRALATCKQPLLREKLFFNTGCAYAQNNNYTDALFNFEQAVQINPHNERARKNIEILKKLLRQPPSKKQTKNEQNREQKQNDNTHQNQNNPANGSQQNNAKNGGKNNTYSCNDRGEKQRDTRKSGEQSARNQAAPEKGQQQTNQAQSNQQRPPDSSTGPNQEGSDNGQPQKSQSEKFVHAKQGSNGARTGQSHRAHDKLNQQENMLLAQVQELDQHGQRLYIHANTSKNSARLRAENGW